MPNKIHPGRSAPMSEVLSSASVMSCFILFSSRDDGYGVLEIKHLPDLGIECPNFLHSSCGITRQTDISLEEPHKFPKCFKPSVKATSNCLAKRSQFAIEKTLFAWRLHRSKVVVLAGGNLLVAGSKHVPPKKRQFSRGSNTYCNMAINSTNYSDMIHDVLWLVIYIYISFVFDVAAAVCLGETKCAKKEWRDGMDLRGIDSNSKLHVLLKIKHDFEMISDGSYTTNRRQIALLSWEVCFFPICFYLSIVHLSSKNGDRDIANLTHLPSHSFYLHCGSLSSPHLASLLHVAFCGF